MMIGYSKIDQTGKPKEKKPVAIKPGKKTKEWDSARSKLKKAFDSVGITTCELRLDNCTQDQALSFAHTKKRRNLAAGELFEVVLSCISCHNQVEKLGEKSMNRVLTRVINKRPEAVRKVLCTYLKP